MDKKFLNYLKIRRLYHLLIFIKKTKDLMALKFECAIRSIINSCGDFLITISFISADI